jgi:hypothetical protein
MGYDCWGLHALMEFAFRFLPIWCHARWCRCSHCEQKHQIIKLYWANTNNKDKAYQVMVAVYRKAALLHVLSGGWWFCENGDGVHLKQLGPLARKELADPTSLSSKYMRQMTTSIEVSREPEGVNLYVSSLITVTFFVCVVRSSELYATHLYMHDIGKIGIYIYICMHTNMFTCI